LIVFIIVCIAAASGKIATTTIADFQEGATSSAPGGLQLGDEVIKVGNIRVHTGEELTYEISSQGAHPVDLTVVRNGEKTVLKQVVFPTEEDSGITFGAYDFYVLALKSPTVFDLVKYSFFRATSLVKMVWDSLYNLITGKYGMAQLSGPVGVTAAVADTVANSNWSGMQIFNYALNITSLISINLGVFNLIPFPALDGGRLLFLLIEAISKKRIPAEIEAKINFGGMVLLMGLMLFVVFKDIISLV
jgi:regulator of sigma E protease